MPNSIAIIYEDQNILVVNKPAGLATQAPRQFDSFEARIREYLSTSSAASPDSSSPPYLGIPHRLDRCASGAMVFAKHRKDAQRLSLQFERREVSKTYTALVSGCPSNTCGQWCDHLRKIQDQPLAEVVSPDAEGAKLAVLQFELETPNSSASQCRDRDRSNNTTADSIAADGGSVVSRLRIQLETGRMHQIRIQSASRGLPVLGDVEYGCSVEFGPPVTHPRERHIALHASTLAFSHPRSRQRIEFDAPFPSTWERYC